MYLFFDTETTGKPRKYDAHATDVDNWPRITQIAFKVYDKDRNLIESYCRKIKPDGWEIPKEEFFIKNGHTTESCEAEGIPIADAILAIRSWIETCRYMAAHNMGFDSKVLGAEMVRLNCTITTKPEKICTMLSSTSFCKLPGTHGHGFKWPKMEELHIALFGVGFSGAHDAGADVEALARCFFGLVDKNVIKLTPATWRRSLSINSPYL